MPELIQTALPLVAAPMAGGPTSPELVSAAMTAGAFGFLAAGYKSAEAMMKEVEAVRPLGEAFGVNLFVPQLAAVSPADYQAYANELRSDAEALGLALPTEPISDDDRWRAKLDALAADPVPVVSFTFGLPRESEIAALQAKGTLVLATVTTPSEAQLAQSMGVDGLIVQGPRSGGHSATFDPYRVIGAEHTVDVLQAIRLETRLPVIAAGGVDGPEAVGDLLAAGAEGVAVGTLFLLSEEAGTNPTHRSALTDPTFTETVITKAFTGRPARALSNDFIRRHEHAAITGYPAIHHLTQPIRRAAVGNHDAQSLHLWAGTGYRSAQAKPAGQIVRELTSSL